MLALDISVVFDFAGNTPKDRAWVRAIFEGAGAAHRLHVIAAADALCKIRLRQRNETKPAGLYFGHATEERFDAVTRFFVPPADDENFLITRYDAAPDQRP